MNKHTPGPWHVTTETDGRSRGYIRAGEPLDGAKMPPAVARVCARTLSENEANARLIAAAPELLEALRHFAALLAEHHDDLPDDRPIFGINDAVITAGDLRRARAAIAKATGAE